MYIQGRIVSERSREGSVRLISVDNDKIEETTVVTVPHIYGMSYNYAAELTVVIDIKKACYDT